MKRALRFPVAILAILLVGVVGVVIFRIAADRVAANENPHKVVLTWKPPLPKPGSAVASYNIYRNQPDGSFKPIASVTSPGYVDHDVKSGATYQYFVKAVDATGHESPPSNPASAKIPK